jgi:putative Ca2+/H+ antiporter (TMEM165/GDT1 family)
MAVIGGQYAAERVSVRTMTMIGAIVFILFGVLNLVTPLEEMPVTAELAERIVNVA